MTSFCAILFLLSAPAFAQTTGGGSDQLHQWSGGADLDSFGESVSDAGDINADGFADVIVGANGADPGGLNAAGSVYVYSFHPYLLAGGGLVSNWPIAGVQLGGGGD